MACENISGNTRRMLTIEQKMGKRPPWQYKTGARVVKEPTNKQSNILQVKKKKEMRSQLKLGLRNSQLKTSFLFFFIVKEGGPINNKRERERESGRKEKEKKKRKKKKKEEKGGRGYHYISTTVHGIVPES